jgi:pre-mRNA-splicing factor SYF2
MLPTLSFYRITELVFFEVVLSAEQRMAAESFYQDANTLLYANNKPTKDAINRVVGKINRE